MSADGTWLAAGNTRDPDLDQLRDSLTRHCDKEHHSKMVAMARTHFDQAIYWLRVNRDHVRANVAGESTP